MSLNKKDEEKNDFPISSLENLSSFNRREFLKIVSAATVLPLSIVLPCSAADEKKKFKRIKPKRPDKRRMRLEPQFPPGSGLSLAPPLSNEEKEIALHIVNDIKHSFAVAASKPLNTKFPKGSYAAIAQSYLKKKNLKKRAVTRQKALEMLNAPFSERKKNFGSFAAKYTSVHMKPKKDDPILRNKLRPVLEREMRSQSKGKFIRSPRYQPISTKTKLEVGVFSGDMQYADTEEKIFKPEGLGFRWSTQEREATHGRWEIEFPPGYVVPKRGIVRTSGMAGKAPGGLFGIEFKGLLPKAPPEEPLVFWVRVQPVRIRGGGGVAAELPTPIGFPSNPVRVAYVKKDYQLPDISEPEDPGPVYRGIRFYVNKVKCIEETSELSASDEILLDLIGVTSAGRTITTLTRKVSDNFDKGEVVHYSGPHHDSPFVSFDFWHVPYSTTFEGKRECYQISPWDGLPAEFFIKWPRTYAVSFIMGEEDIGGGFSGLVKDIAEAVGKKIASEIGKLIAKGLAPYIGAFLAGIVGEICSWVIFALFSLLLYLFEDPDDILDKKTVVLELESPYKKYINALPGHKKPMKLLFVGGEDTAGGKYEVEFQWEAYGEGFDVNCSYWRG